jgi:hypothetical protein
MALPSRCKCENKKGHEMKLGTLLASAMAVAVSTAAVAASTPGVSLSLDKRTVTATSHGTTQVTPNFIRKPGSATIYSNLATKYPNGIYFSGEGDTLCGPDCALNESIEVGGAFTPTANATAKEVDAAVGYIEGTDSITLAIYSDNSGVPGTALWSGSTKTLPTFGDCCGLAVAKIKGGLALTAGTQYWVVATTDKKQTTTFAAWNLATTNQITAAPAAYNDNGTGWTGYTTILPPAFAVYSK